jgi:cholesterol transport system auxiliary component
VKVVSLLLALAVTGCALTDKAEPLVYQYYSVDPKAGARRAAAGNNGPLRLGMITASDHLRSKIVYRTSPVEVGVYDELRWTERPEDYLRRALAHALFDERGLTQVVAGGGPTLDVELLAFEEVRRRGARVGRVTLHYALHDDRNVLASDTVTVDVPAQRGMREVVAAISAALNDASSEVATAVTRRLVSVASP